MKKRDVINLAIIARDIVFDDGSMPEVVVKFIKSRQRRVLKEGFSRLVSRRSLSHQIVIRVREKWLDTDEPVEMANFMTHEMLHARQLINGELVQYKSGSIYYKSKRYWHHYNVHFRRYLICEQGSHESIIYVPWEEEVAAIQHYLAPIVLRRWKRAS